MNAWQRARFLTRAWRYRLRSEKFGIAFLRSRDLHGRTVLDIGANRGIYSYWMCGCVGEEGRVIAFEPQPELVVQLSGLRAAFRLDRLEVVGAGLSSVDDELVLKRPRNFWAGASFDPGPQDDAKFESVPVRVTTLDGYFTDHPGRPVAFIKCDVEGHEHHVFRGARRILTEDRPDLLFECHRAGEPECEVFAYLRSLDYNGFCFYRNGFAPIAEFRSLRDQLHEKARTDFVFLPVERCGGLTLAACPAA